MSVPTRAETARVMAPVKRKQDGGIGVKLTRVIDARHVILFAGPTTVAAADQQEPARKAVSAPQVAQRDVGSKAG